jgi:hypothetical protein
MRMSHLIVTLVLIAVIKYLKELRGDVGSYQTMFSSLLLSNVKFMMVDASTSYA